jgi:hypothetical protein
VRAQEVPQQPGRLAPFIEDITLAWHHGRRKEGGEESYAPYTDNFLQNNSDCNSLLT